MRVSKISRALVNRCDIHYCHRLGECIVQDDLRQRITNCVPAMPNLYRALKGSRLYHRAN